MEREAIGVGPTVEDAIDAALEELGVQQDAVEYEVLKEGGKKIFGLGAEKEAEVRVWLKQEAVEELEAAKRAAREVLGVTEDDEEEEEDETGPPEEADSTKDVSEEDLDRIADAAVEIIQGILKTLDIEATIEEYEGDEGELIFDVVGDDLAVLIGRHGRTLDALQVLVGAAVNRQLKIRHPVIVDVEGYRNRRREKLEEIAQRAADKAVRQGHSVKLRPMSSYERRIVHMYLRDNPRVHTVSEGEEPFRYVVVKAG